MGNIFRVFEWRCPQTLRLRVKVGPCSCVFAFSSNSANMFVSLVFASAPVGIYILEPTPKSFSSSDDLTVRTTTPYFAYARVLSFPSLDWCPLGPIHQIRIEMELSMLFLRVRNFLYPMLIISTVIESIL